MKFGVHNAKFASAGSKGFGGVEKEQKRLNEYKPYKNDVNPELSYLNVYKNREGSWRARYRELKKIHESNSKRKLRKDAAVVCSTIQTVPPSWPREAVNAYFERFDAFMRDYLYRYGVDADLCFLSSATHFDETSPHHTYVWAPFKEGKYQCKYIVTPTFLRNLQKETYEMYLQFAKEHPELEVLEEYREGADAKHLDELEYKLKRSSARLEDVKKEIEEKTTQLEQLRNTVDPTFIEWIMDFLRRLLSALERALGGREMKRFLYNEFDRKEVDMAIQFMGGFAHEKDVHEHGQ